MEIVVKGIAGLFLALGIASFLFISTGQGLKGVGEVGKLPPIVDAGTTLTNYGLGVIVTLIILAIIVIARARSG
ncbi:MAG: hypothetical protein HYY67_03025 [Thaumarchaeota archaeon]|nr:hypothetical protein [Nitrososphaerota archaeon]